MSKYQVSKAVVLNYFTALENSSPETVAEVIKNYTSESYFWRGVFPFRQLNSVNEVAEQFWSP